MAKILDQHKIFVTKDKLTSRGILPSSQELFDLMHLTSCEHAASRWKEYWMFCPVCLATEDEDGMVNHKDREEILV